MLKSNQTHTREIFDGTNANNTNKKIIDLFHGIENTKDLFACAPPILSMFFYQTEEF